MENWIDVVSIRLITDAPILSEKPIHSPTDIVELLGKHMCELDREVIGVINLRSDGTAINCNFVSMGALDQSIAHPREILKSSILSNAASMIMIHNHPSGRLNPSKEDTMLTDRMLRLCELVGIPLQDHVIVGGNNRSYFSFREKEMMTFEHNRLKNDYRDISFPESKVAEEQMGQMQTRKKHR